MSNCFDCKNAYVEDIWMEWDCYKSRIKRDDEGFPSDEEFECQYYEKEEDFI